MLRVSSLGLSLPASTSYISPHFRIIIPLCELSCHTVKILQVRHASDSARSPQDPPGGNKVDGEQHGPKRLYKLGPNPESWKARFVQQEVPGKPVRPLRPPRPPPKYACPPENPEGAGGKPILAGKGARHIVVHPVHRSSRRKQDGTSWDPVLEEILLEEDAVAVAANEVDTASKRKRQDRDALLRILAETHSASEAWEAYNVLLAKHARPSISQGQDTSRVAERPVGSTIPYAHLHRLARLLSSTHPRTRELFLRLLSVLTTIRTAGGTVFIWEWNALIDCAGKGWRKTNIEDYRAAVGIFKDLVTAGQATHAQSPPRIPSEREDTASGDGRPVAQPDIISFTTLLDIASRSYSETAIMHAMSLLDASELPWNHVTHMARLQYFIRTNQLEAVRNILRSTVDRGLDLYTLNGCMWAFARCGRLGVVLQVYELLRRNIPPTDRADLGEEHPSELQVSESDGENPILNIPGLELRRRMQPDRVTYSMLIQALCYHGDLFRAVKVFRDMVSTVDPATRPRHPVGRPEQETRYYTPSIVIYRAIFLGFARHAHRRSKLSSSLTSRRRYMDVVPLPEFAARLTPSDSSSRPMEPSPSPPEEPNQHEAEIMTLENLETFFESFLELNWDCNAVIGEAGIPTRRPSDRMIYWIMIAYAKVTKRDVGKMYKVWQQLDARFGYGDEAVSLWSGRLARIADALEKRQGQPSVGQDSTEIDPNG